MSDLEPLEEKIPDELRKIIDKFHKELLNTLLADNMILSAIMGYSIQRMVIASDGDEDVFEGLLSSFNRTSRHIFYHLKKLQREFDEE
jgi:hypothetical protein